MSLLFYKPSYADAVLDYLAAYPPLYLGYAVLRVLKVQKPEIVTMFLTLFTLSWPFFTLGEAGWWREWSNWLIYLGLGSLASLDAFHALKSARDVHVDYGGVVDAFVLLSALHLVYVFTTMPLSLLSRPTLYRLLLWYFAIYPTALAAAMAGGGRRTTLTITAIYLAAYTLNTEPLLLLLAAIPAIRRLSSPKSSQRT